MKRKWAVGFALALLLLTSCDNQKEKAIEISSPSSVSSEGEGVPERDPSSVEVVPGGTEKAVVEVAPLEPEETRWLLENLVAFNEQFVPLALGDATTKNRLVSATGLYYALAILEQTAEGETKALLERTLQPVHQGELTRYLPLLTQRLSYYQDEASFFTIENSVAFAKGYSFKPKIEQQVTEFYKAVLSTSDDPAAPPALITNVLHFKEAWKTPFFEKNTVNEPFALATGETVQADYMKARFRDYSAINGDRFAASYLVFKDGTVLYLVLPALGETPQTLLNSPGFLAEASGRANYLPAQVSWKLPRVSFENEQKLDDVAESMGLGPLYSGNYPGFMGPMPLTVGAIRQKAFFAMNETGAEVKVRTEIGVSESAAGPDDEQPEPLPLVEIHMERPYLLLMTSREGIPLFTGVVNNPGEEGEKGTNAQG